MNQRHHRFCTALEEFVWQLLLEPVKNFWNLAFNGRLSYEEFSRIILVVVVLSWHVTWNKPFSSSIICIFTLKDFLPSYPASVRKFFLQSWNVDTRGGLFLRLLLCVPHIKKPINYRKQGIIALRNLFFKLWFSSFLTVMPCCSFEDVTVIDIYRI